MVQAPPPWTLGDLIDFEAQLAAGTVTSPELRQAVQAASAGSAGAAARRVGLRVWLDGVRAVPAGRRFESALAVVAGLVAAALFLLGTGTVWGLVDRARSGVDVSLYMAVLIGGQWLVLLTAAMAWLTRRRTAEGFSVVQAWIGQLARRFAGQREAVWWTPVMASGGPARAALLWRLAQVGQAAGVSFNVGALAALAGLVMVRHVGFYWETSTELAMHSLLEKVTQLLAVPWAAWWPAAVPDAAVIDASRWVPGRELGPGPAAWWQFLWMATLVWGLLPRLLLWGVARRASRRALQRLEFQGRAHRALWRDLTAATRDATADAPLDGVLVLDVGGSGLAADKLRPFLLRRLRVHPASWQPVAVLDPGAEAAASRALALAPAGVVLLAEGWALSPARMTALHRRVRAHGGPDMPIYFVVADVGPDGTPLVVTADERREWERLVDSLGDAAAEVYFYEPVAVAE